eukprot:1142196-Pelagomonas_calceolata.AAC.2
MSLPHQRVRGKLELVWLISGITRLQDTTINECFWLQWLDELAGLQAGRGVLEKNAQMRKKRWRNPTNQ